MAPEHYWTVYEELKTDESIAAALNEGQLEALARLVRELSENAYHHGGARLSGKLMGWLSTAVFELRLGGQSFDSKAQAAKQDTGALYSSNAALVRAGGSWSHRVESGWNVYQVRFSSGAVEANGEANDVAE